ncbi:MAG: TolC family protein [Planctomycetota bacterium]
MQADRDAYSLIEERNGDPRWATADYSIELDPRSRYYDVYDPDHAPMPQDDPASHEYMQLVDGHEGWDHWHDNGERAELENPNWREALGDYVALTDDGAVKLNIESALQLAYMHSPTHQRQLENLYQSALNVSLQRFELDTQYFGGTGGVFNYSGSLPDNSSSSLQLGRGGTKQDDSALFLRRKFASAGEFMVGFANTFTFEFASGNTNLATSLLNYSLTQPLLRGAGRDRGLEALTSTERILLANLRGYDQFRQGFYTQIAIGELGVREVQPGGPGTNLDSFSGSGGVNGFFGLLQNLQSVRYTYDNLKLQERTRDRLEALYDSELIELVQVDQFRQSIERTRAELLENTNGLKLRLDNYKTGTLGLPSSLPLELDQTMIQPFQLFPREADPILDSLFELQERIGDIADLIALTEQTTTLQGQIAQLPAAADIDTVDRTFGVVLTFAESMQRRLVDLEDDIAELASESGDLDPPLTEEEQRCLQLLKDRIQDDPESLKQRFRVSRGRIQELSRELTDENREQTVNNSLALLSELLGLSEACLVVQSRTRQLDQEPDKVLEDAAKFVEPVRLLFDQAREDLARMDAVVPVRERTMNDDQKQMFRDERERLHERMLDLEKGDAGFEPSVERLQTLRNGLTPETRATTVRGLVGWIQRFIQVTERLTLVPAQARLEVITLDPIIIAPETAFQVALDNRLDFMNGRAALVDRWRQIQFTADQLQSNLTIAAEGDVRTARDNPASFRAPASNFKLSVQFDAPFTRLQERNEYRQTLITYQQNRRTFIQSRDNLEKGLRALLRTLEQRRQQLDIQRRAVTIAMRLVDQTQLSLSTPPPQLQPGQRAQISPTTAINLLNAQASLQNTQNAFLAAWLNFYSTKLRLYRELGIMEIDVDGRWIETPLDELQIDIPADGEDWPGMALPPDIPPSWLDALNEYQDGGSEVERSVELPEPGPLPIAGVQPVAASVVGPGRRVQDVSNEPSPAKQAVPDGHVEPDASAGRRLSPDAKDGIRRPQQNVRKRRARSASDLSAGKPSTGWRATKPAKSAE